MNWIANTIDRTIDLLWPSWGVDRRLSRLQLEQASRLEQQQRLVGYPDAQPRAIDKPIFGRGTSSDYGNEVGFDRRQLTDRARQLEKGNLLFDTLLERATEMTVGENGFQLRPTTNSPSFNTAVKELWDEWCEEEADCRGLFTFTEILEMQFRSTLRDGDFAVVALSDGTLRLVESDEISDPEGGHTRPSEVDGVELDPRGKPIAFQIFNPDPDILWADRRLVSNRTRVPAKDVFFTARRQRAGQTRGISAATGGFWLFEQLDGVLEATAVKTRVEACFGVAIKKVGPFTGLAAAAVAGGMTDEQLRLGPLKVMRLQPGDDITPIQPTAGGPNFEQVVRLFGRFVALRMGMPLEIGMLDVGGLNLSSLRGIWGIAKKRWKRNQRPLRRFSSWTYRWKVLQWMREGRLPIREDALSHRWKMPGWPWLDPESDLRAALGEVDAGIASKSQIAAERGHDYDEITAERELEIDLAEKHNVPEVRSTITRDPGAPMANEGGGDPRRRHDQARSRSSGKRVRVPRELATQRR